MTKRGSNTLSQNETNHTVYMFVADFSSSHGHIVSLAEVVDLVLSAIWLSWTVTFVEAAAAFVYQRTTLVMLREIVKTVLLAVSFGFWYWLVRDFDWR